MFTKPKTNKFPRITQINPMSAPEDASGDFPRTLPVYAKLSDYSGTIDSAGQSRSISLVVDSLSTTILSNPLLTDELAEEYGLHSSASDAIYIRLRRIALVELQPIIQSLLNQPVPSVRAPGKTIDRKTIAKEDKEAIGLMRRFAKQHRLSMQTDEFPYNAFVDWLFALSFRVKPRTFKQYRNHVIDYLQAIPGEEVDEALNLLSHSGTSTSNNKDRTCGDNTHDIKDQSISPVIHGRRPQIIKQFPWEDFQQVLWNLRFKSRSPSAGDLAFLLEASIISGLRPSEWKQATLISEFDPTAPFSRRVFLFVANAKTTNGRGNGVVRTLDLSAFADSDIRSVIHTIGLAKQLDILGKFDSEFLKRFISMISRLTTLLWGSNPEKAYSLYSCRHQASANWKTAMTTVAVAALSGHAVPRTTARWYGKKKDAWPKQHIPHMAKPLPAEVMQIDARMVIVDQYEADMKRDHRVSNDIAPRTTSASPCQSP